MSIFGKLRSSKNADTSKEGQTPAARLQPNPYRHVPTHAASDALSQAPPGATAEADRLAIQEQRRRRNEMSRQASSLSIVTTLDRSSVSNADTWVTTTTDQRRTPLVFQSLNAPFPGLPTKTRGRDPSPTPQSDKSSSTASSSSRSSALLEIPSRSPRSPRQSVQVALLPPDGQCLLKQTKTSSTRTEKSSAPGSTQVATQNAAAFPIMPRPMYFPASSPNAVKLEEDTPQERSQATQPATLRPRVIDFSKPRPQLPVNSTVVSESRTSESPRPRLHSEQPRVRFQPHDIHMEMQPPKMTPLRMEHPEKRYTSAPHLRFHVVAH